MAMVIVAGLLSAAAAHIYHVLNRPTPVPDLQMAALHLHDGKLRLEAAERTTDPERSERLLIGAEFDLLLSNVHATKAELSREDMPVGKPSRKR